MTVARLYLLVVFVAFARSNGVLSADLVQFITLPGNQTAAELPSTSNGEVLACAGGYLYRFSINLTQLQTVPAEGCVGLSVTEDNKFLVVCLKTSTCIIYSAGNLSLINSTYSNLSIWHHPNSSVALFTSTVYGMSFYVGSEVDGSPNSGLRLLQRGFKEGQLSRDFVSHPSVKYRRTQRGFHYKDKSYFLSVVYYTTNTFLLTATRVCEDGSDEFHAVSEILLRVVSSENVPVITGVSLIEDILIFSVNDGLVQSYPMKEIDFGLEQLYAFCLFHKFSLSVSLLYINGNMKCTEVNTTSNPMLCDFNLLDDSLILTRLSTPRGRHTTIPAGVTSSLAIMVNQTSFLFVGILSNTRYFVEKYLLTRNARESALLYKIAVPSEVTALTWPRGADYVFATSDNQIIRLPVEICSSFTNCSSCVQHGDPLCGWCSLERKCSRSSECSNVGETRRYIQQGEHGNCTDSLSIDREQLGSNSIIKLTFTAVNPPPTLPSEQYLCVFTNEESGVTFNASLSTDDFTCNLANSIPQLTQLKLVTNFSLYSDLTQVAFLTSERVFTFYNCSYGTSCSMCVETESNCGWCLYDFICTPSYNDCPVVNSLITINTSQTFVDVCPVLRPTLSDQSEGHYVQPVEVSKQFTAYASNLPAERGLLQYQCRFGEVVTSATRVNSSSLICAVTRGQLTISPGISSGVESLTLSVIILTASDGQLSSGSGSGELKPFDIGLNISNQYALESSSGETLKVVLYQCSRLATGCSSCLSQRLGTTFECGWCTGASICLDYTESCSSSFVVTPAKCELPVITAIHPTSGPTAGGTILTINGTNLGIEISDISVAVGNLICFPDKTRYLGGRSVTCEIQNNTGSQSHGVADVVLTVDRKNGSNGIASTLFRFEEARIFSVHPSFGPASGGTTVTVRGEHLDIGNQDRTRVFLEPAARKSSRQRRETNRELASCKIISIFSAELMCKWDTFVANTSGELLVFINNAIVRNSSVTHQYLSDPVYESVTPKRTIQSGGIKITFTGQFLNVSFRQILLFNNGQTSGPCGLEGSTATSLVCLTPPVSHSTLDNYTVMMDAAPGPDITDSDLKIVLVQDPTVTPINVTKDVNTTSSISIPGENILNIEQDEIVVLVGVDECTELTTSATAINCLAPLKTTPSVERITVQFGRYLNRSAGQINYTALPTTTTVPTTNVALIIGATVGSVAGVVVIITTLIIIIGCCYYYKTMSKYKGALERAVQPVYVMLPEHSAMQMTENLIYKNASLSNETNSHFYEELPESTTFTNLEGIVHEQEEDAEMNPNQQILEEDGQVKTCASGENTGIDGYEENKQTVEEDEITHELDKAQLSQQDDAKLADKTDDILDESGVVSGEVESETGGSDYYVNDDEQICCTAPVASAINKEEIKESDEHHIKDDQLPGSLAAASDSKGQSQDYDDIVVGNPGATESNLERKYENIHATDDQLPGDLGSSKTGSMHHYVNLEPNVREITVHLKLLLQQEVPDIKDTQL